jgi:hypothetical protein
MRLSLTTHHSFLIQKRKPPRKKYFFKEPKCLALFADNPAIPL